MNIACQTKNNVHNLLIGWCEGDFLCSDLHLWFDGFDCIQLCLSDATDCNKSLLLNGQCDDQCDGPYCMMYEGDSFINPEFWERDDGALFAADLYWCEYNTSSLDIDYPLCTESAADSIYIDPNVPSDQYELCPLTWIGDGYCDDSCRVSECGYDASDCEDSCDDGFCSKVQLAWNFLSDGDYKVNTSQLCANKWDTLMTALDEYPPNSCSVHFNLTDFNGDGFTNFRELIPVAYMLTNNWTPDMKSSQLNCSECVGMDSYNV